jgi:DNA polymerase III alpha subunit
MHTRAVRPALLTNDRPLWLNFSGAEAEELHRTVGMRRSWERMKNLEGKLRAGMTTNGLDAATQETIIQNISSFALGIANVIVTPDLYERERLTVVRSKFLLVEGVLQNQDGVIHIKATRLTALLDSAMELRSHDFH